MTSLTLATVLALVPIVVGVTIALVALRRPAVLAPVQTFAFVSALVVVLLHLLPEALKHGGAYALLVFVGSMLAPAGLNRGIIALYQLSHQRQHPQERKSLPISAAQVGFWALVLHQLVDGLALGLFARNVGEHANGHSPHYDVLLALALHSVPVTAFFVLRYQETYGVRAALRRTGVLAFFTAIGATLASLGELSWLEQAIPIVSAATAGFLLHLLVQGVTSEARRSGAHRFVELGAGFLAIAVTVVGGSMLEGSSVTATEQGLAHHPLGELRAQLLAAFSALSLETAPTLLVGLVLGAAIQALNPFSSNSFGRGVLSQAVRGSLLGAPLPVCSCGVLPLAESLRHRGAGPAFVAAFLLATPELGVETVALTAQLFGWPFAILRLCAALLLALVAGLWTAWLVSKVGRSVAATAPAEPDSCCHHPVKQPSFVSRTLHNFDDLILHLGPWVVFGLIAAAYITVLLPPSSLEGLAHSGLDVLVISILSVPTYICATSSTPLAAVLMQKGVSQGALLVALLLGPATNVATLGFLTRSYGARVAWSSLSGLLVLSWAFAYGVNALPSALLPINLTTIALHEHAHQLTIWTLGTTTLMALLLLRSMWQRGLRQWFQSVGSMFGMPQGSSDFADFVHNHP